MIKAYFIAVRGLLRVPTYLLLLLYLVTGFLANGYSPQQWMSFFLSAVILAAWYINATSVNDLKDYEIDRINLSGATDRPLVTGAITQRGLVYIAIATAALSLALAGLLGVPAILITVSALAFNYIYSMPPLAISRRGGLALASLPFGYVGFTLVLGSIAGHMPPGRTLAVLLVVHYCLFLARISLKDYRDVTGDAKFGKRTFLLRHGSKAVVRLALASHILGSLSGLVWLYQISPFAGAAFAFIAATAARFLWQLREATDWPQQRVWITAFGRLVSGQVTVLLLGIFANAKLLNVSNQLPLVLLVVVVVFVLSARQIIQLNRTPAKEA